METTPAQAVSTYFIWRRVHSLMGLWLIIYLIEHLLVNSQAALWVGDDGAGFIKMVNGLESLPYLQVIEWLFIGIPLLIHGIWGVKRALQAKSNSFSKGGKAPHLQYQRNRAFTWQRLTSWILLVGIILHVIQMRFIQYPTKVEVGNQERYLVKITFDSGLYTLAPRLGVVLHGPKQLQAANEPVFSEGDARQIDQEQRAAQMELFDRTLSRIHLKPNEVVAEAATPGAAMLLMVRDTFKSPLMAGFYTIFVLAAAFHAFNGFWTALITWGILLSYRSQRANIPVSVVGIFILSFLGLAAIWGSYWINLRN